VSKKLVGGAQDNPRRGERSTPRLQRPTHLRLFTVVLAFGLVASSAGAFAVSAAPTARDLWYPASPSPRDGLQLFVLQDVSCDQALSRSDLSALVQAAVTESSWREGRIAVAGFRGDAIRNLGFESVVFHSSYTRPVPVLRDLKRQRDHADLGALVRHVERARRGPCETDSFEVWRAVHDELAVARSLPVLVAIVSNGIVAARGMDFCRAQPNPAALVHELQHEGRVFRLSGVRIVWIGLGVTATEDCVGSRKLSFLREFWSLYADASGADIAFLRNENTLRAYWRGR
jgi:hypothetical protein